VGHTLADSSGPAVDPGIWGYSQAPASLPRHVRVEQLEFDGLGDDKPGPAERGVSGACVSPLESSL
jgi:hypothetical protein